MKNFEDMDNKEFAFTCLDELEKAGKLNTAALATMTNPGVCHDLFHSSHFPYCWKFQMNARMKNCGRFAMWGTSGVITKTASPQRGGLS